MKPFFGLFFVLLSINSWGQGTVKKVLFVGNSYTYTWNLPRLVEQVANSTGDGIQWDMAAPGGADFITHVAFNPATTTKIKAGIWDYVVLQEQSLSPATPDIHTAITLFRYAKILDSLINTFNPCAETMFYMTWGRRDVDSVLCEFYTTQYNWPYFCSTTSMDSVIRKRYQMVADSNKAEISPVGAVWAHLRRTQPTINLYALDGSHPSLRGSYAAACSFYTAIFRKNPELITFNAGLPPAEAALIRSAARQVVFDSLSYWNIGKHDSLNQINCTNLTLDSETVTTPWQLYPNPTNHSLRLKGEAHLNKERVQVEIINSTGEICLTETLKLEEDLDISILEPGLYFLKIENDLNWHRFIKL